MKANGELSRIRRALQRHPELELAILFGSLAHDTFRHDSDIDLAVSAGSRLSAAAHVALIDELASATGRPAGGPGRPHASAAENGDGFISNVRRRAGK